MFIHKVSFAALASATLIVSSCNRSQPQVVEVDEEALREELRAELRTELEKEFEDKLAVDLKEASEIVDNLSFNWSPAMSNHKQKMAGMKVNQKISSFGTIEWMDKSVPFDGRFVFIEFWRST